MRHFFCIVCREFHYEFPGDTLFATGSHTLATGEVLPLGYCQKSNMITNLCYRKVQAVNG